MPSLTVKQFSVQYCFIVTQRSSMSWGLVHSSAFQHATPQSKKFSHILFLPKDRDWLFTFLEGKNVGAEDLLFTLDMFQQGLLQSSSALFLYPRCLSAYGAHQVCPWTLSFSLVLSKTDKLWVPRPPQNTVNKDNQEIHFKFKFLTQSRLKHKPTHC